MVALTFVQFEQGSPLYWMGVAICKVVFKYKMELDGTPCVY